MSINFMQQKEAKEDKSRKSGIRSLIYEIEAFTKEKRLSKYFTTFAAKHHEISGCPLWRQRTDQKEGKLAFLAQ